MRANQYRKLFDDLSKRMPVGSTMDIKEQKDGKYTRFSVSFTHDSLSFQTWYNTHPGAYDGVALCWYGAAKPLADGIFGSLNIHHRTKATDSFHHFDQNHQAMVNQINRVFDLMENEQVFQ